MKSRTNIIFCGFNTFLWGTAGIAITVHSNNAASCAVNPDLQETYGDDYTAAWATQVTLLSAFILHTKTLVSAIWQR